LVDEVDDMMTPLADDDVGAVMDHARALALRAELISSAEQEEAEAQ
jgi:hypothetical protein